MKLSVSHATPTALLKKVMLANTALAIATVLAICPVFADVIDIAPDGATTVYNAPAIFYKDGAQNIANTSSTRGVRRLTEKGPSGAIDGMISIAASRYAINAALLQNVAWQESQFRNDAVSPRGAVGIMQLMPETARALNVNQYDPMQNIMGGAAYLRQMLDRYNGSQALALAAYNAGPGAVDRYRGIPPYVETLNYTKSIMSRLGETTPFSPPSVIFIDR